MEVKPVGPERNRQVAELRGDHCMHFSALPIEFQGEQPACRKGCISFPDACCREGEQYCLAYEDAPYSTFIAAAFELSSDHMKISVFKSGEFGFCAHAVLYAEGPKMFRTGKVAGEHEGDYHDTKEKAIADAISGAYVKWMVTNNG